MRELTLNEVENVSGGEFSSIEFEAAVLGGAIGGGLAASIIPGAGTMTGAFTGAVLAGIVYLSCEIYTEYAE